ncbi:acyclic terpene utilization AtuA family protein [[Mycobacterium] vasticus]|uniref:Acyclic terpene utilization AtuA family protein n=1 Tax=[Mycobacterium] vasticus TaxID=2875777 RepID=A0ABU5YYV1_9MYCO|nr:acyclic terpene utilization AtuA family protein [Mycolicibacter sp. MYC017]MEB3070307.1 acyclic terpene utilization AtuA family protein [Mycolicibacter sp. MYC017]
MTAHTRPIRIANCSGFYGDRLDAPVQILRSPEPIDVLTGDWLAELTMSILAKSRMRGRAGYATTFITQMQQVLGLCHQRGIKVVSNAGGVDPHGCAAKVRSIADDLGIAISVAVVDGDDLLGRLDELRTAGECFRHLDTGEVWAGDATDVVAANAYLGGHGITAGLRAGADVVITGRVADAAVVSGAAAWWHDWDIENFDALAGATVAGHAIECGTQVTGGNFAFFDEIPDLTEPGFPIAEIAVDGSSVITKVIGTGGAVTVDTVTAQLLYEISGPRYPVPDVVARFDTVQLRELGTDRVQISAACGEPAPECAKALLTYPGGFRNAMTLAITGAERHAKAELAQRAVWAQIPGGQERFAESLVEVIGAGLDSVAPDDQSYLRLSVSDPDSAVVGREFSSAAVATALGSYPGLYLTTPPGPAAEFMVGWPTLIDVCHVHPRITLDGSQLQIMTPTTAELAVDQPRNTKPDNEFSSTEPAPITIGEYLGARSGDKGGNANLGLWVRDERYLPLLTYLTEPGRLASLLPEFTGRDIRVYPLPNLNAVNVVIAGLLGHGVAASLREDPQAKSLGERFRAVRTAVPGSLLSQPTPEA